MAGKTIESPMDFYFPIAKETAKQIQKIIYEIAEEENLGEITESLKWGESSFSVNSGSPVRMDWKEETPDYFYIYFNCRTLLVETFRIVYESKLEFQGNRAIKFDLSKKIPFKILKDCLSVVMKYKKLKGLPLLGM